MEDNIKKGTLNFIFKNETSNWIKKNLKGYKNSVVKPIISENFNSRAQIDLIDMQSQPDGAYKFILQYQDHATKSCDLRGLVSKRAAKVALNLLDLFFDKGAPMILQSDIGHEFVAEII